MELDLKSLGTTMAVGGYLLLGFWTLLATLFGFRDWSSFVLTTSEAASDTASSKDDKDGRKGQGKRDAKREFTPWAVFIIAPAMLTVGLAAENQSDWYAGISKEDREDWHSWFYWNESLPCGQHLGSWHPESEDALRRSVLINDKNTTDVSDDEWSALAAALADQRLLTDDAIPLSEADRTVAHDIECHILAQTVPDTYSGTNDSFNSITKQLALHAQNTHFKNDTNFYKELKAIDLRLDFARAMVFASTVLGYSELLILLCLGILWCRPPKPNQQSRAEHEDQAAPKQSSEQSASCTKRLFAYLRYRDDEARLTRPDTWWPLVAMAVVVIIIQRVSCAAYEIESQEYDKRVFGFHVTANSSNVSSPGSPEPCSPQPTKAQAHYDQAVADAIVAEEFEVAKVNDSTKYSENQLSRLPNSGTPVEVISWMTTERADAIRYAQIDYYTPGVVWVTLHRDITRFIAGQDKWSDDSVTLDLRILRMEQLLGLPPDGGKEEFVTLTVRSDDLFRPADRKHLVRGGSAILIHVNQRQEFPTIAGKSRDEWFDGWFAEQCTKSYPWRGGFPWTRLGYTYDWSTQAEKSGTKDDDDFGLTEFCVFPGSRLKYVRTQLNKAFLTPLAKNDSP